MQLKNSILSAVLIASLLLFFAGMPTQEDRPDLVPLADVVEQLELDYEFNTSTGILKVEKNGAALLFQLGTTEVNIPDGTVVFMKEKTQVSDAVLLIPAGGVDLVIRYIVKKPLKWGYEGGSFFTYQGKRPVTERPQGERMPDRGPSGYEVKTIIIDPGHGGKDPGGIGHNNVKEKDIVLKVALELQRRLKKTLRGIDIIVTREDDTFISLEDRSRIANSTDPAKNPIYVSIHANVSFSDSTQGFESYFLTIEPVNEEARDVASMENSVLGFEIEDYNEYLKEIINRIVDIEYRRESMKLAQYIQSGIEGSLGNETTSRGVKSAFFYVLKAVKMPSVLIEIGFVTNSRETQNLLKPEYEGKIAKGIAQGIVEFTEVFSESEGFTR
ncbi:MAG TPA: N-acetylmuramoyl-L-alanine amidase [Spirochaetota bacterium]|nr:N-acetylmuramoyl-L-alanine amidase [Spirochaetota bacterium]